MDFTFTVNVECERIEGKFASKDELADQLFETLDGADPQQLTGENDGEYEVTKWEVVQEEG
jgi:hypothetical protein